LLLISFSVVFLFFQAEDGIRDRNVTGVQTCALPICGLAMLGGFITLGEIDGGSYSLATLLANPPRGTAATIAVVLILIGALSKSAQIPFHFWLPSAMAAPTPVSAYLHAAAMVKAGVYLIARLAPAFATLEAWRWMILIGGGATMLIG